MKTKTDFRDKDRIDRLRRLRRLADLVDRSLGVFLKTAHLDASGVVGILRLARERIRGSKT